MEHDRENIISALCLKSVILTSKAELDQLLEGLQALDMLSLIRSHPCTKQLFIHVSMALTGVEMFKADLSPEMSNSRELEECQLLHWARFLEYVGGISYILYSHPVPYQFE